MSLNVVNLLLSFGCFRLSEMRREQQSKRIPIISTNRKLLIVTVLKESNPLFQLDISSKCRGTQ